jgi:hypothetical protein
VAQEKSIYSTTQDQIQQKNILIKDEITEVQALTEDVQRQLNGKRQSASAQKSTQVGIDIMNTRVMRATLDFKQFLTDHQQTVKIQEEKKGRLKAAGPQRATNSGLSKASSRPMKILPGYQYSQVANSESTEIQSEGGGGTFSI